MPEKTPSTTRPADDDLLDTADVAKMCAVSERTIEGWRSDGYGPAFVKVGKSVRYRRGIVKEWLDSRAGTSTADFSCGRGVGR